MPNLPVVFIESEAVGGHGSNPPWLALALQQARHAGNRVVFIADNPSADFPLNGAAGRLFREHYAHLSRNHEAFEKFCLERWFVLKSWMEEEEEPVVLYLDSDVLLFAEAQAEWDEQWGQYDYTLSLGSSPASSYMTWHALEAFCDLVQRTYVDRNELFQEAERIFASMKEQGLAGGISDMFYWKQLAQQYGKVGEMTDFSWGTTWDHNINAADGYWFEDGHKQIVMKDGIPFGFRKDTARTIRFKSIHFQGGAKGLLQRFALWLETQP